MASPLLSAIASAREYDRGAQLLAATRYRLTTGQQFITTGDNTASTITATGLQNQSVADRAARANSAAAGSLLQIAQEGLGQIRVLLDTLNGLATDATKPGLSPNERSNLNAQFQGGLVAIDAQAAAASFNGQPLLDGSIAAPNGLQYTVGGQSTVTVAIPAVTSHALFGAALPDIGSVANAQAALASLASAQIAFEDASGIATGAAERFDAVSGNLLTTLGGITTARDALLNIDRNQESLSYVQQFLRQNTAAAVLAQSRNIGGGNLLALLH